MLSEREFVEMVIRSYKAGHTLLKLKIRNSPHQVEDLDQKINYLQNSQLNKFKNIVVQEFNKYKSGMQVRVTRIGTSSRSKCGSRRARSRASS